MIIELAMIEKRLGDKKLSRKLLHIHDRNDDDDDNDNIHFCEHIHSAKYISQHEPFSSLACTIAGTMAYM